MHTTEFLEGRFGTIPRTAQKYIRARHTVESTIPSGEIITEAAIREATMKLYRNSNKTKKKDIVNPAPTVYNVEALLFLRDDSKYVGVGGLSPPASRRPSAPAGETPISPAALSTPSSSSLAAPAAVGEPGEAVRESTGDSSSPTRSAAVFVRPPGIKKHKMFLAIQKHKSAGN